MRLLAEPLDDFLRARTSFVVRLEHDVEARSVDRWVDRARADRGRHARHVRVLPDDIGDGVNMLRHGSERNIFGGVGHADDHAGVLLREQSFRDHDVEQNGEDEGDEENDEDETLMVHDPAQAAFV